VGGLPLRHAAGHEGGRTIRQLLSDREQSGPRGWVKTVADERSTTVLDREGKILE
jgi:hypothetical protein